MDIREHKFGEVCLFSTKEKWEEFRETFKAALAKQSARTSGFRAAVSIRVITRNELITEAIEMNSRPYAGYAVAYLSETAVAACKLIGLELPVTPAPNKKVPNRWSEPEIKGDWYFPHPIVEINAV